MDVIVENLAPQICAENPTEECPAAVDAIIRNGLPLLAAASDAQGFAQVLFFFNLRMYVRIVKEKVASSKKN